MSVSTDPVKINKVSARWVPRFLSQEQEAGRGRSEAFVRVYERQSQRFLDRIIITDETLLHYSDPKSKQAFTV